MENIAGLIIRFSRFALFVASDRRSACGGALSRRLLPDRREWRRLGGLCADGWE